MCNTVLLMLCFNTGHEDRRWVVVCAEVATFLLVLSSQTKESWVSGLFLLPVCQFVSENHVFQKKFVLFPCVTLYVSKSLQCFSRHSLRLSDRFGLMFGSANGLCPECHRGSFLTRLTFGKDVSPECPKRSVMCYGARICHAWESARSSEGTGGTDERMTPVLLGGYA